jgi:mono/diheme cytochrome c family protein
MKPAVRPGRHPARSARSALSARSARSARLALWPLLLLLAGPPLWAQTPLHQYPDADIASGEKLLREHQCAACHARKVGGDGSAIYRPAGRINTPTALLTMVERCNTELNLGLFPEDTAAVAAVLQRDHYRFKAHAPAASPAPAAR